MNVLNQYFEKIYVITSESTKDRIPHIKSLFEKENILFDFHYAVNYKFIDPFILNKYLDYLISINEKNTLPANLPRISCAISHLQVLRQFQYSKYKNVLILEDDIFFESNYQNKFLQFINEVPKNWDIINLGRNYSYNNDQIVKLTNLVNIPKNLYGAHAYAFSRNKIEEFCEYFEDIKQLPYGPDPHFVKMYNSGYNCYCPSEYIIGALSMHFRDDKFIKTKEKFESFIS